VFSWRTLCDAWNRIKITRTFAGDHAI